MYVITNKIWGFHQILLVFSVYINFMNVFMVFELFFGNFPTVHSPVKPTKQPYWARAAALCHKSAVLFVSLPSPKTYAE